MNLEERIEALLAGVVPQLQALGEEAMGEISQARSAAYAAVRSHREAREQLAEVQQEITRLSEEREELPNKAYRAGMDEDYTLEDDLKERYKNVGLSLESLNERRDALQGELGRLGGGERLDVQISRYAEAAGVAHERRLELEDLKKRLTEALDTHLDPVIKSHADLKARVEALSRDRAWEQSPVGRGGIRI